MKFFQEIFVPIPSEKGYVKTSCSVSQSGFHVQSSYSNSFTLLDLLQESNTRDCFNSASGSLKICTLILVRLESKRGWWLCLIFIYTSSSISSCSRAYLKGSSLMLVTPEVLPIYYGCLFIKETLVFKACCQYILSLLITSYSSSSSWSENETCILIYQRIFLFAFIRGF